MTKRYKILAVFILILSACSSDPSQPGIEQKDITLSGTINVTYNNNVVPFVEIGVNVPKQDWISSTRLDSPKSGASWSIDLTSLTSSTKISFKVIGYNDKNKRLFIENIEPDPSIFVFDENKTGITLNLGNISNSPVNIIPLIENKWSDGEITVEGSVEWYSILADIGTTYYLWWNDTGSGDGTKMLDIDVYAYDSNVGTISLENDDGEENDSAWDKPVSFTAFTGWVYVRVRALNLSSSTGSYSIVYNKSGVRPDNNWLNIDGIEANPIQLTQSVWKDGILPSSTSGRTVWYSFNVTSGTTYYVWWNDKGDENNTKTLDIKVDAYYVDDGYSIFTEEDKAWATPMSFTASSTGKVKLKVSPYFRYDPDSPTLLSTGTFALTYNTSGVRPSSP